MNADAEAQVADLVDRAVAHHERTERQMEDAIENLRVNEATIREVEAASRQELRKLREEVDEAHQADIDAYAQALVDGQGPPKPTASRMRERMKRIETLVLPGADTALWLIRDRVINALRPEAEQRWLLRLRAQLQRWAPPKIVQDPSGILGSPRAEDPANAQRPDDIVAWVVNAVERLERFDAERIAEQERKERHMIARNAVDTAQAADERCHFKEYEEQEAGSARKRHAPAPPYPGFDRRRWLEAHSLLADYGWHDPSTLVQVKGGRERDIEIGTADDRTPTPA